jgi:bifunctional N-acetylglucosamine-1-phosphate-uridyltransferase/glucosamine-1-phosphate-acetyltransferase GlmU-like protein
VKAQFVLQSEPKGMGDAILKIDDHIENDTDILLVWSDIPLLSSHTVKQMADCHRIFNNDFTFVTALCDDCYTIVEREVTGKLLKVIETRAAGIPPGKNGERDIGLFIFKKEIVFPLLKKSLEDGNGEPDHKEKGFLHIIELLALAQRKAEGYPIALPADVLSFNSPDDLDQINKSLGLYK